MTKAKFQERMRELPSLLWVNESPMESVAMWKGQRIPNVFTYAATSEACMERQLADNGKERKTTFMSDLSIGEWAEGRKGVIDTLKRAINEWKDNEVYMAELVLCVNWKSWEHDARGNRQWSIFYAAAYEWLRDLVYEYYENDKEKTTYVWEYLD